VGDSSGPEEGPDGERRVAAGQGRFRHCQSVSPIEGRRHETKVPLAGGSRLR
jgi:hypothetical protein